MENQELTDEERAESMKDALRTGTMVEWLRDPENWDFASRLAKERLGH